MVIKTAIIKTDTWNLEVNNHQNINREEEYKEFCNWFNSLLRGKTGDLIALCNKSDEGNKEGIRINISTYGNRAFKVLKALYDYTLSNPNSFKTTENCIGFRWEMKADGKPYNIIIDRDFKYIYTFRK